MQHRFILVTLAVPLEQEPGSGSVGGHATCTTSDANHQGFTWEISRLRTDGLGEHFFVLWCCHRGPG
jgi:hypothetical protein